MLTPLQAEVLPTANLVPAFPKILNREGSVMRVLAISLGLGLSPVMADTLSIRLDQANSGADQCPLVFVFDTTTETEFTQLQTKVVLLNTASGVLRLSLLDFQSLPAQGMRVRSFNLPNLDCADVGRVLFNAMGPCTPLAASACTAALTVSSETEIEVLK